MKILIVDDEELIRNVIKEYAKLENYIVFEACDGKKAVDLVKENDFDIIVMDIMMPVLDGYQALKEIKKIKSIPCIMLSARNEEYDKLLGFEIGVDDYLAKPFSPKELMARIKAIINRSLGKQNQYVYDGLKIDDLAHEVFVDDKLIELTPKEYSLLLYLVQNKNIALTREMILSKIWGYDFYGDDRTIDTHIKTLRNRLGKYRLLIKTVRGMGYKFVYQKKS